MWQWPNAFTLMDNEVDISLAINVIMVGAMGPELATYVLMAIFLGTELAGSPQFLPSLV